MLVVQVGLEMTSNEGTQLYAKSKVCRELKAILPYRALNFIFRSTKTLEFLLLQKISN